jgi:hypothetical protein
MKGSGKKYFSFNAVFAEILQNVNILHSVLPKAEVTHQIHT